MSDPALTRGDQIAIAACTLLLAGLMGGALAVLTYVSWLVVGNRWTP
jgi:hypothetical protein